MKSNAKILLIVMLLFAFAGGAVHGQSIPPADLPTYSPPLDSSDTTVWLIKYDLATGVASEMHTLEENISPAEPATVGSLSESSTADEAGFSGLVPALSLPGWPQWPIGVNVRLELTFDTGESFTCSGTMIGPNYVLTAGHCVYLGSYIVAAKVVPAYDYGPTIYPSAEGISVITFNQWIDNENYSYDIAIVELGSSIGYETGWHGLAWFSDLSVFFNPSSKFHNFSYPASNFFGVPVYDSGERMYYKHGFFDYLYMPGIIGHNEEGFKGQSGSSIYFTSNENKRYVTGILSNGSPYPIHHTNYAIFDGYKLGFLLSVYPSLPTEPYTPVGIQEEVTAALDLSIYPNPSSSQINVELPLNVSIELVEIYAADGKKVYASTSAGTNQFSVDLKSLALSEAIYTVAVHTSSGVVSGRFLYEE